MLERELIRLICVLRDHIGKSMAVLAYRDTVTGCASLAAAPTLIDLHKLIAEDYSINVLQLHPDDCYLTYGTVYGAEDLPYEIPPGHESLVLINDVVIFKAVTMQAVLRRIEAYLKTDLTKGMGSMAVIIGDCKTEAYTGVFLEKTKQLRKLIWRSSSPQA